MARTISVLETIRVAADTAATYNVHGWVHAVRKHGKMTFIDLRDHDQNLLQVVLRQNGDKLNREDTVTIEGRIVSRPVKMFNPELKTGKIEFIGEVITIHNKCKELPIPVDGDGRDINEELRLRYRYLDLRRPRMQQNIRTRAAIMRGMRHSLDSAGLVEIETPILTQSTQEGARDFVVPSRFHKGKYYALPQSPQQYKQLLMTAGFEGYYQIARCFRDEALRSDRGFEFTQLDMELSWGSEEDVIEAVEGVLLAALHQSEAATRLRHQELGVAHGLEENTRDTLFPVYTYEQAMKEFGTDKPDIRTEVEKTDGTLAFCWITRFPMFESVKKTEFNPTTSKSPWTFMHNPFSMPIAEHREWHLKGENIGEIKAYQYDLVCNGLELGSGSVRAHSREILEATYKVMGYSKEETEASVGHMLEAFDLGTPPHAGFAVGIDRLAMLICGETSMKEVIPFPMTSSGKVSVMEAPSEVDFKAMGW